MGVIVKAHILPDDVTDLTLFIALMQFYGRFKCADHFSRRSPRMPDSFAPNKT